MNVGSQYRHLKPCINQVIFLFRDQRPNMEKVTSLGAWYSWVPTMKPLDSMDSPLWLNRIFFLVFIPTTMKLMEIWTSKVAPFVKRLEIWFSHILPAEQMLVRRFWCFFGWNKCFARDLYQKYQTFPMSELHREFIQLEMENSFWHHWGDQKVSRVGSMPMSHTGSLLCARTARDCTLMSAIEQCFNGERPWGTCVCVISFPLSNRNQNLVQLAEETIIYIPRKYRCTWKKNHLKMKFVLATTILRGYVSFREGSTYKLTYWHLPSGALV